MNMLFFGLCLCISTLGAVLLAAQESSLKSTPRVVILLGPPGSGKGTQAVRITKELGIPHISTGDLFRENVSKNTELGQRAKTFMNAGKLVPDQLVLDMLFDRVSRPDCAKGYLLDGFPRTLAQAEAYEKNLAPGTQLVVLDLEVPDAVLVKRVADRLTCKDCGNVHNLTMTPPKKAGICDKCQGTLIQRPDDKAEVVQERLKVYHTQTQPLEAYYEAKGLLQRIDGTQTPDQVYQALMSRLKK